MTTEGDFWRDVKAVKKAKWAKFGVACPLCHWSILLPGYQCRIDGFRDARPPLTDAELESVGEFRDMAHYRRWERAQKKAEQEKSQ